jgi:DNA replication protein DnaD
MSRMIYDYTKSVLEKVSFDTNLFMKELRKAMKKLLPYEIEHLKKWLIYFTDQKPELKPCLNVIMENE